MDKIRNKVENYGKWALITGASSGIGKEFAYRLASFGLKLIITARRVDLLNEIKSDLEKKFNIDVEIVVGDLSDKNTIDSLKECILNKDIGLLVNNAGFGFIGQYEEESKENYSKMLNVNCVAPTLLAQFAIKEMKKKGKGAIIFLGSTFAFLPTPYASLYSATKSFNNVLASCLYAELKPFNIDVLSLNPGGTDTEFKRISNNNSFTRKPSDVVETALKSLCKKPYVVDGVINKVMVFISKFVSPKILLNTASKIARKKIEIK